MEHGGCLGGAEAVPGPGITSSGSCQAWRRNATQSTERTPHVSVHALRLEAIILSHQKVRSLSWCIPKCREIMENRPLVTATFLGTPK